MSRGYHRGGRHDGNPIWLRVANAERNLAARCTIERAMLVLVAGAAPNGAPAYRWLCPVMDDMGHRVSWLPAQCWHPDYLQSGI